jgi:hypothetical protein
MVDRTGVEGLPPCSKPEMKAFVVTFLSAA